GGERRTLVARALELDISQSRKFLSYLLKISVRLRNSLKSAGIFLLIFLQVAIQRKINEKGYLLTPVRCTMEIIFS
ncbi:hypothetical protein BABA_08016, partial [Neobacillus bataviensis LMG 21833]